MLPLPGYPLKMSYQGLYQARRGERSRDLGSGDSGFRFTLLLDMKTYALRRLRSRLLRRFSRLSF